MQLPHEFHIDQDASRYYMSGKGFLYRTFPFWMASLISRILETMVPVAMLLIPALKLTPTLYRWRIESRINRQYRVLQNSNAKHRCIRRITSAAKSFCDT